MAEAPNAAKYLTQIFPHITKITRLDNISKNPLKKMIFAASIQDSEFFVQ
jgi:hypothetical protein